ncbi:MAG: geranylgeranylglycerol-phosphate geranylgeranyltransferase [Chitinispirillaceae bacterium]|jgi:4-hydroxybenzoate polyprenyltransferase
MASLIPYFKITRLHNALLTGMTVALGFWLGRSVLPFPALVLLIVAGIAATAFGNVINDIHDVATDRISHPSRPLPRNELSVNSAWICSIYLMIVAVGSAAFVSLTYLAATLLPILLLACYTRFLKGTPFAGNIVVSLLVGYAILYGGLLSPAFPRLIIPALLAFLLNFVREIIKAVQDTPGDRAAGIITTAALPSSVIKAVIYTASGLYLVLLFFPWVLHQFGSLYACIAAAGVLPLHVFWLLLFRKKSWRSRLSVCSLLIKCEMLIGIIALTADQLITR